MLPTWCHADAGLRKMSKKKKKKTTPYGSSLSGKKPSSFKIYRNGPIHCARGGRRRAVARVPRQGVGVVKWMNGIRSRPMGGGGAVCVTSWTRLPSQPDLNGSAAHQPHTHVHKRACMKTYYHVGLTEANTDTRNEYFYEKSTIL